MRWQGYVATLPWARGFEFLCLWAPKAVDLIRLLYPRMGPPHDGDYADTLSSSPLLEVPRW